MSVTPEAHTKQEQSRGVGQSIPSKFADNSRAFEVGDRVWVAGHPGIICGCSPDRSVGICVKLDELDPRLDELGKSIANEGGRLVVVDQSMIERKPQDIIISALDDCLRESDDDEEFENHGLEATLDAGVDALTPEIAIVDDLDCSLVREQKLMKKVAKLKKNDIAKLEEVLLGPMQTIVERTIERGGGRIQVTRKTEPLRNDCAGRYEELNVQKIEKPRAEQDAAIVEKTQLVPVQMMNIVPLQPWEAEKLHSMAQQVLSAMEEDRYDKDYGAILLNHFGNWRGADEWAQKESAILHSLVDADDAQSRQELRRWIETSLVGSLREVQKEVNRGVLAGLQDNPGSVSASGHSSRSRVQERPADEDEEQMLLDLAILNSLTDCDAQEQATLNEALAASLQNQSSSSSALQDPMSKPSTSNVKEKTWEIWPHLFDEDGGDSAPEYASIRSHSSSDEEFEYLLGHEDYTVNDPVAEVDDDMAAKCGSIDPAIPKAKEGSQEVAERIPSKDVGIASDNPCEHACDLQGGCCRCVVRAPRPGVVPNLYAWWRQQGLSGGTPGDGCWRFFCSTCAVKSPVPRHANADLLPLPFGGVLSHSPALKLANEIVQPERQGSQACVNDLEQLSECGASSKEGSWVMMDTPCLLRSVSGSSWVLPDE